MFRRLDSRTLRAVFVLLSCALSLPALARRVRGTGGHPASGPLRLALQEQDPSAELREEHFALALGDDGKEEVGLLLWRRRCDEGVFQLEWEVELPLEEGTRVLHVERLEKDVAKLVWREVRPHRGQSVLARWTADGALNVQEWSGRERIDRRFDAEAGAVLPLYLLELARGGGVEGSFALFDPLSRTLEDVAVRTRYFLNGEEAMPEAISCCELLGGDGAEGGERIVLEREFVLERSDGTLVGAYRMRGDDLVSFRWQSRGLSGRRISADDYAAWLAARSPAPASDG